MRITAKAKAALARQISDLVAQEYAQGNIPSQYNGTLKWPMVGQVTQDYGCTGFSWEPPLGSCAHFHQGIDIVAPNGTPVKSSGSGTVVYCGWNYADGADPAWIVIIAHSQSLETWYAHLQPSCPGWRRRHGPGRSDHRPRGQHRSLDRRAPPLGGPIQQRLREPAPVPLAAGVAAAKRQAGSARDNRSATSRQPVNSPRRERECNPIVIAR